MKDRAYGGGRRLGGEEMTTLRMESFGKDGHPTATREI
jgi:hypothetical protein